MRLISHVNSTFVNLGELVGERSSRYAIIRNREAKDSHNRQKLKTQINEKCNDTKNVTGLEKVYCIIGGHEVVQLVEALCYKPEDRGFGYR
jgi:hypothetical protein